MDTSRTISELKSSFIRTQVRILSAALEPQEGWRAYGVPSEEGDLSDKAVEEALQKCMDSTSLFIEVFAFASDKIQCILF